MACVHIDRLLETCIRIGADDVYLTPGRPPELWFNGALRKLETKTVDAADTDRIARELTPESNWAEFVASGGTEFDLSYSARNVRFRVTVSREHGDVALVFRQIRS